MSKALTLDKEQIEYAETQARAIANNAKNSINSNEFVYFAAFDGTNNDSNDLATSGNPLSTNVAQLANQVQTSRKGRLFSWTRYIWKFDSFFMAGPASNSAST